MSYTSIKKNRLSIIFLREQIKMGLFLCLELIIFLLLFVIPIQYTKALYKFYLKKNIDLDKKLS